MAEILSDIEISKIFSWRPYRDDWPVDRNEVEDNIESYYGSLIDSFLCNELFNCIQVERGGTSNFLCYLCYPLQDADYSGPGILVYVNLCAPVATYGVSAFNISEDSVCWDLLDAATVGIVEIPALKDMEAEIRRIIAMAGLTLLPGEFLQQKLPEEVYSNLEMPLGDQYIHGLFQVAS